MKTRDRDTLIETLERRFGKHMHRHQGVAWTAVLRRLERSAGALDSLQAMEASGGEPDVIGKADSAGRFSFYDCSAQSPGGRRSVCYDRRALNARKEHKPKNSAVEMAEAMGIELLTEEQYRHLQQFDEFDTRTSSWIMTPADVRSLGGALFCDRRYGRIFTYHNGAESYYAARGFRGVLRV